MKTFEWRRKTTKVIKLQWIASIWRQNDKKNVELRRKTFKTTQNNASDHIIIIASIWRQNDQNFWVRLQNYKSNQITMDCIDLTVKRSKQRKTTNKRDQITINLHRFDVKTIKTTNAIKLRSICTDLTSKH